VSSPAPPRGVGNPCSWPSAASTHPNAPDGGTSGGRSACAACAAISRAAPAPRNSSSASRRIGSASSRAKRTTSGPSFAAIRRLGRTGGNGVTSASATCAPTRSQMPNSRRHASPSPGAKASTDAIVSSIRGESTTQVPSDAGWATA
jgi:hypothetical protein